MRVATLLGLGVLVGLFGCASAPRDPVKGFWVSADNAHWARVSKTGVTLKSRNGTTRFVPAAHLQHVVEVKERIETVSGQKADLGLVDTNFPNAFALQHQGRPVIAFSLAWLAQLGHDPDAVATTVGHELAHLQLGHSGAARKEREETARGAGMALGTIANAIVPFSGYLVSAGTTAYARGFTRDEERAADELGLRWAVEAGYDPCGKARVVKMYQRVRAGGVDIPLLSTHPSLGERSELANAMSQAANSRPCD